MTRRRAAQCVSHIACFDDSDKLLFRLYGVKSMYHPACTPDCAKIKDTGSPIDVSVGNHPATAAGYPPAAPPAAPVQTNKMRDSERNGLNANAVAWRPNERANPPRPPPSANAPVPKNKPPPPPPGKGREFPLIVTTLLRYAH